MQNHRDMHATLMSVLLVPLERGISALRPTPRVIRVTVRTAYVFDVSN